LVSTTKSLVIILGVILVAGFSVFGILLDATETELTKEETIKESNKLVQPQPIIIKEITPESQKDPADFIIDAGLDSSALGTEYASQIISNCYDDFNCALNSLRYIEDTNDADTVLSSLTQLLVLYNKNHISCHATAHHLGKVLYSYVEEDLSAAFEIAGQQCGGAIFHGVIENYFAIQLYEGIDPDTINISDICPKFEENPYEIERWQCLHGIGHGLGSSYDFDVFTAVKRCNVFESGWEQISCTKGVFMSNIVKYVKSREGNFDEDKILYPCNEVDAKFAPQCYHYQTTYIIIQNGGSVLKSFADCDRIEPEEFVKYCYHGMGRQIFFGTEGKFSKINQFCQMGEQEQYYTDCFRGMVMIHVNNDRDPSEGFVFCKNIPDHSKTDCYDALGKWIVMLYPEGDQRIEACSNIDDLVYYQICINASLEGIRLL